MDTQPTTFGGRGQYADSTSEAVVRAVATRTNDDPTALPPLFDRIDPDAIDTLFEPTRTGFVRSGRLEFEYAGQAVAVSVDANGERTIELEALDDPDSAATDADRVERPYATRDSSVRSSRSQR